LTSVQLGFRSLALQKRSSEVRQFLGAIKTEFDRYGTVVNTLSRQLTTASNSVESLGRRTRAISRRLKGVETPADDSTAEALLGFSTDDFITGGDEAGVVVNEPALA
jgi:DNA recombination protein RmuC